MTKVMLINGPFAGTQLDVSDPRSGLALTGTEPATGKDVPEGFIASYRPTRKAGQMRFRGYARVLASIPVLTKNEPGAAATARAHDHEERLDGGTDPKSD